MTTNDNTTTNSTAATNTAAAEPDTGTPPRGLAARAITAARHYRATDPAGYHNRHADPQWARRAATAREVAIALAMPVDAITVTDDPARCYGIAGQYAGDLITATDPDTGEAWRFAPDFHGSGWLLLGPCPTCREPVPHARVTSLVDLGAWCDPDNHPGPVPREFAFDPAHHPTCPYSADNRTPKEH